MSFLAIFIASLLGSLHCVGMCGGFVAMAGNCSNPSWSVSTYHIGRLIAYAALGALAGMVGSSFNEIGVLVGISYLAPIVTGLVLIWWGFQFFRTKSFPSPKGTFWQKASFLFKEKNLFSSFFLGCSSAFLPCGWLYVFLASAASLGSAMQGALAMTAFWLGTVPSLTVFSGLTRKGLKLSRISPTMVALLLIFAGVYSIGSHLYSTKNHQEHSCHSTNH